MGVLNNKTAIVTGGSSGFGAGIAAALIAEGCTVWITARSEDKLNEVANQIGARAIVADVTDPADWDRVFDTVTAESGTVDILVNNAGGGISIAPIVDQTDNAIVASISVNLTSAILGSKRAAKIMQAQRSGMIINISSICAVQAWEGWGIYAAAKAGLNQFSKSLYVEMRPHNVRATLLMPSWGATGFQEGANLPPASDEIISRMISPEDIGKVVVDICKLPVHLVVPELTLLPLVQDITPY